MKGFITGPKEPGIVPLEHELNDNTVQVFMDSYPLMQSNGWKVQTVPDAYGMEWYQNAQGNDGAVVSAMSVGEAQTALYTNASWANPTSAVPATASGSTASGATNVTGAAGSSTATSPSHQQGNKENSATHITGAPAAAVILTAVLSAIAL